MRSDPPGNPPKNPPALKPWANGLVLQTRPHSLLAQPARIRPGTSLGESGGSTRLGCREGAQ